MYSGRLARKDELGVCNLGDVVGGSEQTVQESSELTKSEGKGTVLVLVQVASLRIYTRIGTQ
jgi:hypothetical protein